MMKQAAGFLNKRTFWRFIVNSDWSLVGKCVSWKMEIISDVTVVKRITLVNQQYTYTGKKINSDKGTLESFKQILFEAYL